MNTKDILNQLRQGNLSIITQEVTNFINQRAMYMLTDITISPDIATEMDDILRICNILYNCTDINVLPIEDGVYDILLEKYKKINPNFQVGSEVLSFAPTQKASKSEKYNPIIEYTDQEIAKIEKGEFYQDLRINTQHGLNTGYAINPIINTERIDKRTHNTENNHPSLVGTLDKAKFVLSIDADEKGVLNDSNVSVLERDFFFDHIQKGIIKPNQEFDMVLELKYDGISVEADCDMFVESARTRGDTGIGQAADISPILAGYPFPNARGLFNKPVGVKFEAIMTKDDLYRFNIARGVDYKNCRTAIVGLFGSSDGNLYRNFITLVPLELDRADITWSDVKWNRHLEIEFLNKCFATKGCPLRYAIIRGDYKSCLYQIKMFLEEAEVARKYLDFMYDGIVVSYLDEDIRAKLGRKNHINKYSMAVKFNPLKRLTHFTGYTFHVGQDGSITPKIHYEPVEFFGSIHPQSTGNSYARFKELNLRIGDVIEVEYVNDVIDRVNGKANCAENIENEQRVEPVPFAETCPACGAPIIISPTGKSAYCSNPHCSARELARVVNMMDKLNLKDFGEAKIATLNVHSLKEMMNKTREELVPVLGEVFADKFMERMQQLRTNPMPDYMLVGALGFTGISTGKWKLIFERMTITELLHLYTVNSLHVALCNINGVGDVMVNTIISEIPIFMDDLKMIEAMPNIVNTFGKSALPKVVFTGFRDADFAEWLSTHGYEYKENLTKDTAVLVIPYVGFTSTKISKVGPETKVISSDDFKKETGYVS